MDVKPALVNVEMDQAQARPQTLLRAPPRVLVAMSAAESPKATWHAAGANVAVRQAFAAQPKNIARRLIANSVSASVMRTPSHRAHRRQASLDQIWEMYHTVLIFTIVVIRMGLLH